MKRAFFIIVFVLASVPFLLGQSILGEWKTIDDETGQPKSIVKIYKAQNGMVYGKITKLLDLSQGENPLCKLCPDERKNKPVLGMVIIRELSDQGSAWGGGKILDPEKGKEYGCKIWVEGGKLKVRGYWGMFYRTQTWIKA
ncbi:MAG: DUF2147 domain-containing protein [Microscillaceae bacterium]|nr:DUF2147 domain-containing protein [Microscillaceae bacterium]